MAAIHDAKTFTIPNVFPILVAGLFILAALFAGLPLSGWGWHILSGGIAFAIGLALFVLNVMGGGDVKLFAAIALWFTPSGLMPLTLFVTAFGTVLGLSLIIYKMIGEHRKADENSSLKSLYQSVRHAKMPYGPAIAVGTIVYLGLSV